MTDVLVVGGGIIGLTAAVRLQQRGARVTVWAADPPENTVSAIAAAVWYPTRTDPDPRVLGWAGATFDTFRREAAAGEPGVLMRRTRMLLREPVDRLPWWAPAARDVVVAVAPAPYAAELTCTLPLVEMGPYLAGLVERITAAGGRVVRRRVGRLDEALAEVPVVVNATGLAAGGLCEDPAVFPVRGHVVLVANPGLDVSVRDEGDPAGTTYVHPRTRDVVLGGTYEPGATDPVPDPAVRAAILARCRALVPALAGAPVVGERVGLRPARRGGPRVAAETLPGGRLVHAYGHGGAGMTLAWGCADEVADLALGGR
ncbi:MAG TPA: FAD-dependent oxidoreductase [Actinoplanes sp.]|jgi:D-amino-acid oxidase